jgi:CRP-like cAMP-binding protein
MRDFNPTGDVQAGADPYSEAPSPLANALLRTIGADASAALVAAGRRTLLRPSQTLWRPGQRADAVCFPMKGLIAGLAADQDGASAQVECVGPDGAAGLIEGLAGADFAFEHRAMVETEAWMVPAEAVRGALRACPATAEVFQRHMAQLYDDARRAGACASRHALRARLADCLLAYQEKTLLGRLPLTQEALSAVLGANRTTVTALAIALSEAGLTRTGRGWVSIEDRERLDRIACGCRQGAARSAPPPPSVA